MYTEVRLHVCGDLKHLDVNSGDLCSVGFINLTGVVAGVQRQRLALSIGPI
jgi:hypothetical protein